MEPQQPEQQSQCQPEPDWGENPNAYAEWLSAEDGPLLSSHAGRAYPELARRCAGVVSRWRLRFTRSVWQRALKRGRLLKELQESLPVIARVLWYFERELASSSIGGGGGSGGGGSSGWLPRSVPGLPGHALRALRLLAGGPRRLRAGLERAQVLADGPARGRGLLRSLGRILGV